MIDVAPWVMPDETDVATSSISKSIDRTQISSDIGEKEDIYRYEIELQKLQNPHLNVE